MAATTTPAPELIRCERQGCRQVLAKRYPSGDVRPVVTGIHMTAAGAAIVECPACRQTRALTGQQKGRAMT